MALLTCAEATGRRYSMGTISSVPMMASGMRPPSRASKRAPMRDSGSITRCIGRLPQRGIARHEAGEGMARQDARKQAGRRCRNCRDRARRRARGRRPRRSRGSATGRLRRPARACTSAPRARRAAAVHSTSSPSSRPRTVVSPSASAPNIRARWETDLSPGARTRPCRRATERATSLAEAALADRAASTKDGRNATRRPRSMPEFGFDRVKDA